MPPEAIWYKLFPLYAMMIHFTSCVVVIDPYHKYSSVLLTKRDLFTDSRDTSIMQNYLRDLRSRIANDGIML